MFRLLRSVERLSLRPLPVTLRQHPHYCSLLQSCKPPLALSLATIRFMFNSSKTSEHSRYQLFQQYDPDGIKFMKPIILNNATSSEVINLLSIPPIRNQTPYYQSDELVPQLLRYIYHGGYLTELKYNKDRLRFPNLYMEKYFYDKIVKDWIEKVSGREIQSCQRIAFLIIVIIRHIEKVQYYFQTFLRNEVQKNKIKQRKRSKVSKNKSKFTELYTAFYCIWRIIWNQRALPTDQLILLSPLASPTIAVVTDFKIVPSNIKNQQKAAEELLESVIWSVLRNWHQQSAACFTAYFSQEKNKIENVQIVAIVGHSKQKVWIESHTFTKEKWIQLTQLAEECFKKGYDKHRKEPFQAKILELKNTEPFKQWTQPKDCTTLKTLLQMFEIQGQQKILKDSPLKREEETESNAQDAQQSSNQGQSAASDEKTKQ